MWKKRFGERTEEARHMKVTPGKCVRLQISADFSGTPNVTEQNTSTPNPEAEAALLSFTHGFLLTKENISPLFISLLAEQYVAAQER